MAIDLIKSYLVGIGFTVDENSFNQTQSSMDNADKTINKFNKNSQEGFSSTNDALKGLFNLFKTSSGTLGKLFPELHAPLNNFLKDIALIKKLYSDLTKEFEKSKAPPVTKPSDNNENTNNSTSTNNTTRTNRTSNLPSIIHNTNELANSSGNLVEQIINTQNAAEDLAEEGGNAFKLFSLKALGPIAAIVAGVAATTLAIKGLVKYLGDLANQDIEYEKLSRQLWTTKENAKEVDMALKTMGITMQDLWLSPTLLKQFNELRKDSSALKLPKEYTDNLKVIQGIGLEFSRLKQLGQLAFQWIGNYILKYAAEPLNELRQLVHSFNDWLVKNIPNIGKIIGTIVGVLIRIIAIILKIIGVVIKLTSPIIHIIELIGQIGDEFEKLPEPIKTTLKIIGVMILAVASPILFVIGLIDDLMTYFRGGKSLTGTVIDKIADKLKGLGDKIKNFSDACKNILKNIGAYFKKIIDEAIEYLENKFPIIKKTIDFAKGTKEKWNEFWGNDEESKKKKQENMAELIKSGLQFKQQFSLIIDKNGHNNTAPSYVAPNDSTTNSTTTTNSHNQVSNTNNINVYGGSDAKVTANTVKDRLTSITTRNLRGAY